MGNMPLFLENLKIAVHFADCPPGFVDKRHNKSCPPGGFGAARRVRSLECTKKYCNAAKGCQNELENTSHKTTSGMREWI